jgi:hypothetical protein
MKSYLFFTLLLLITSSSCTKESIDTDIQIRIENTSSYEMENIKVISFGEEYLFGDLAPGAISDYQIFSQAYSYAYIEVFIDGKMYALQPIDFVGEEELDGGQYTYILDANDSGGTFSRLRFSFRED